MNRKKIIIVLFGVMIVTSAFVMVYSTIDVSSIISVTTTMDKKVAAFYYGWYGNATDFSQSSPYPIEDTNAWWERTKKYANYDGCSKKSFLTYQIRTLL